LEGRHALWTGNNMDLLHFKIDSTMQPVDRKKTWR